MAFLENLTARSLDGLEWFRNEGGDWLRHLLAGDEALSQHELASADDGGLHGPESATWQVHGDAAMLIGGLRALLLQTLHPLAMAGVSDHSDYRTDPWGRLRRTSRFIGATTYGSTATAERAIGIVRRIHDRVEGVAPDGRPYRANDPHLLMWVHLTEVDSFLGAFERYGHTSITEARADDYVAEMAGVATRLGVVDPPTDRAGLHAALAGFRPECYRTDAAAEAVRYLLRPPMPALMTPTYGIITGAAVALLPVWARQELRLPIPPGFESMAIVPSATMLTRTLDWMLREDSTRARVERHNTDTTEEIG